MYLLIICEILFMLLNFVYINKRKDNAICFGVRKFIVGFNFTCLLFKMLNVEIMNNIMYFTPIILCLGFVFYIIRKSDNDKDYFFTITDKKNVFTIPMLLSVVTEDGFVVGQFKYLMHLILCFLLFILELIIYEKYVRGEKSRDKGYFIKTGIWFTLKTFLTIMLLIIKNVNKNVIYIIMFFMIGVSMCEQLVDLYSIKDGKNSKYCFMGITFGIILNIFI